ncbi:MAG: 4-(cytidine 5'-diphospho)-2-C-methyl-D-erythritol kinase [Acidobacteria bacterium]|nr:4-(cytidine 5'-diphospho)-2-C-methyl-D-erythritol kinase [Acidobacteriota bacterium]
MLTVNAHAKINLALAVLGKRSDGFHEIRSVFQTISLADRVTISFQRKRQSSVAVSCSVEIPGTNLAEKAARAVLEAVKLNGQVKIHIDKRIPMGGGLGGGSTDAAAILMALPALAGKAISPDRLKDIAVGLGSDVPFFLRGGCAVGMGQGEELYPLPDPKPVHGLLITPQVHVSTKDAYAALGRSVGALTSDRNFPILKRLQSLAWALEVRAPKAVWAADCQNDFEEVVFRQYPVLQVLRRKLSRMGAAPALMTGSGAALFGLYDDAAAVQAAIVKLGAEKSVPFSFLSRTAYQSRWRRWLSSVGTTQNALRST